MTGKTITIQFGNVFTASARDLDALARRIEKSVQVNTDQVIESGAYKHNSEQTKPLTLTVTVSLTEEGH